MNIPVEMLLLGSYRRGQHVHVQQRVPLKNLANNTCHEVYGQVDLEANSFLTIPESSLTLSIRSLGTVTRILQLRF